jgi:alkylation response protein AidB-like acyl-CoA dehydrogenase
MNFELTENQTLLKDGVDRFVAERYDFESRRKRLATLDGTDRAMWAQFAQMGWLALLVPEAQGGFGWGIEEASIVLQAFGRALVVEPYLDAAIVAVLMLEESEADNVKSLLSDIATGEALVSIALIEAGSRYRYTVPSASARLTGNGYELTGSKILVAGGDAADWFIVSADLDGELGLFVVPGNAEGVSRGTYQLLDGSWSADVAYDAVALPSEALLASGASAVYRLDRALDSAALGIGAQAVGSMDRILEITNDYLNTRKQFGQPLADFQVLQHRMADLFIDIEMARSALYGGFAALGDVDAERQAAISAARVRIDAAGQRVGNMGIHLHGGMGMTMEYPVGHHYRRLVQLGRAYGDAGYHLERYESLMIEAA